MSHLDQLLASLPLDHSPESLSWARRHLIEALCTESLSERLDLAPKISVLRRLISELGSESLLLHLCEAYNQGPSDILLENLNYLFELVESRGQREFLHPTALQVLKKPQEFLTHWGRLKHRAENGDALEARVLKREDALLYLITEEKAEAAQLCLNALKDPQRAKMAAKGLNQLQDKYSHDGILNHLFNSTNPLHSEVQLDLLHCLCKLGRPEDAEQLLGLVRGPLKEQITGTELKALAELFNLDQEALWAESLLDDPRWSVKREDPADIEEAEILHRLYAIEDPLSEWLTLSDRELKLLLESLSWNAHLWESEPLLSLQKKLLQHPNHYVAEKLAQMHDLLPERLYLREDLTALVQEVPYFWAQVLLAAQGHDEIRKELFALDVEKLPRHQQEALCRLFCKGPEAIPFFRRLMESADRPAQLLALQFFEASGLNRQDLDRVWKNLESEDTELIRASLAFFQRHAYNPSLKIANPDRFNQLLHCLENWDADLMQTCPFHGLLENLEIPQELLYSEKDRLFSLVQRESLCPSVRKGLLPLLEEVASEDIRALLPLLLQSPSVSIRQVALNLKPEYFHPELKPLLQTIAMEDSAELRLRALKLLKHLNGRLALWIAEREMQECALVRRGLDYFGQSQEVVYDF